MNEGIYYLRLNGTVEGPFTIGQIYDLWAARKINSQTAFARFEEMDKWQPLSELTLKISSPKPAPKQTPEPAAAPASPTKAQARESRSVFNPEEFPSFLRQEPPPARPARSNVDPLDIAKNIIRQPRFAAGVCIVLGVGLILYFAFLFPLAPTTRDSLHDLMILKQTGVLTGVGLLLLSGLLLIAQQLSHIHRALLGKENKPSSSSTS